MSLFQRLVLHRFWLPAVAIVCAAVFIPRASDAIERMSGFGRVAGVWGWEQAPEPVPVADGGTAFRFTKSRAALREPIRGRAIQIPLLVVRPDPVAQPLTVLIKVGNYLTQSVTLSRNGWHLVNFDLVQLMGEARWRSQGTITLTFVSSPTIPAAPGSSTDARQIGVGLGEIIWKGPPPR